MLIPNKYDLMLLGNIIVDDVYCISSWPQEGTSNVLLSDKTSIGGIGNIINSIREDNLSIFVQSVCGNDKYYQMICNYLSELTINNHITISDKTTSHAIIICGLTSNERTSFVNWGCGSEVILNNEVKSKWAHISYLDICHKMNIQQIKNNADIVSADLCLSSPTLEVMNNVLYNLQYLDYLFISEAESNALFSGMSILDFVSQYKLKCLIFHTRDKTCIVKNGLLQEVDNTAHIIDNINVLGAGDAYCGNFITYQLTHESNEIEAAKWAHKQATTFILRANEKV